MPRVKSCGLEQSHPQCRTSFVPSWAREVAWEARRLPCNRVSVSIRIRHRSRTIVSDRHSSATALSGCPLHLTMVQELTDRRGDLVAVCLERKVAGVQEAHICGRDVTFECLRTRRQEERIVLAPHGKKRRLMLAKIGLEFGIERDVALVVAEQVELHL